MSVSETIAGLPFLSKQEVLMELSQSIGKAEGEKRTVDLLLGLAEKVAGSPESDDPRYIQALGKGKDVQVRLNKDLLLYRSIVHHRTRERAG